MRGKDGTDRALRAVASPPRHDVDDLVAPKERGDVVEARGSGVCARSSPRETTRGDAPWRASFRRVREDSAAVFARARECAPGAARAGDERRAERRPRKNTGGGVPPREPSANLNPENATGYGGDDRMGKQLGYVFQVMA